MFSPETSARIPGFKAKKTAQLGGALQAACPGLSWASGE